RERDELEGRELQEAFHRETQGVDAQPLGRGGERFEEAVRLGAQERAAAGDERFGEQLEQAFLCHGTSGQPYVRPVEDTLRPTVAQGCACRFAAHPTRARPWGSASARTARHAASCPSYHGGDRGLP